MSHELNSSRSVARGSELKWTWLHGRPADLDRPSCLRQTTGTLRLFIDPGNDFQFVLDHKYRMQQREVTLAEGPHDFTFWAPKYRMIDTTITVVANTVNSFTLRLPVSAEYMAWQREMSRYKRQVVLGRGTTTGGHRRLRAHGPSSTSSNTARRTSNWRMTKRCIPRSPRRAPSRN